MTAEQDPLIERAQTRVGRVLKDKWRLDSLLGVGGMASVYAATHRNGARVAVKMLHSELSIDPNVRGRFLREGYVANAVGHRGAVTVLDDDVAEDGSVFLVMELLDGETLEARRERSGGRLDAGEVLSISDQLLDVLTAAHAKGIVHRDLKPENIFVTVDSVVKVLDFGIARVRQLSTASTATRTGTTMGTPAFMPPEQARGRWELVDPRSDLWAVGASMFTLLTGRLAHEAVTMNEQLLAAMTRQAPSLGSTATFPRQLVAVVDRALAYEMAERWPDAVSMQEAIREAYHAIFCNPIGSAAKLTVPPSIRPPALHSAPPRPGGVTTSGPVSKGRTGVSIEATLRRLPVWAWPVAGVTAAAVAVVVAIAARGGGARPTGVVPASGQPAGIQAPQVASAVASVSPPASAETQPIDISALPIASGSRGEVHAPVRADAAAAKPLGQRSETTSAPVDYDRRK